MDTMAKEIVISRSGLTALEQELEELKTVRRKDVAEKIKTARGFGDLSENSEYDEAKNEQAFIESRIAQLEAMLKHVRVIDNEDLNLDAVSVGSHVKIEDEDGDVDEYDIVGSTEADPMNGKISDESPVGAGLLGKKVGETAEIQLPNGATCVYKILEISRAQL
ncbi:MULTISPECIES: transcription elongation factor GreA [Gemmiger]|uniref:transcription elongation factor GreA n=2 Tax=Gemmiger TaxID=204475 RepID=UPI0023B92D7E|nr:MULTISPECIES: transcription elongation factor GreA [Gemmiger]